MRFSYRIKIAITSVLIVVFFLVLNLTPLGKEVKNFFYLIAFPIQRIFWDAGNRASGFFEFIIEMKHLKEENEELKLKIQDLLVKSNVLEEFKKENEMLREALKIGLEKDFKLAWAEISGKKISPDLVSINKGAQDGILKDFPVITQQKILVGKIGQVYKNFSEVLLISHPQSVFNGKVTESEILGVVKGEGNLKISFEQIPKEAEIGEGDLVVTSALAGDYPQGLIVGEISQVKKSDLESFQSAQIQPGFDIKYLEKLFIITEW